MRNELGSIGEFMALRLDKRLNDQASRLARIGSWECDLATEQLSWTDFTYELFGIPVGSPLKRAATVGLYVDESRRDMEAMRAEAIRSQQCFIMDAEIRTNRGEGRWIRIAADVAVEQGRAVRLFGAKQDITREREAWARLRELAERDPLTGLANRGMFDTRYRAVIGDELRHASVSVLALIDLDRFKAINDRLGHAAGDECLRQTAQRLQRLFGDAILVARIGGDEFAVLLRAPLGPARIAEMLQRASRALSRPIIWNDVRLDVSASIGATVLGQPHLRKLSGLFGEADAALYEAKRAGRNTVRVFGDASPHATVSPARLAG